MEVNGKLWIATIWLCCTSIVVGSHTTCSDFDVPNLHNYTIDSPAFSLTIDVKNRDPQPYIEFLKELRTRLKCSESHGIPVLCPPAGNDKVITKDMLFFVDLSNKDGKLITLAFQKVDLYLVGFKTGNQAYFFKDDYEKLKDKSKIFNGVKNPKALGFTGSYSTLPNRECVPLGILALRGAIDILYDYNSDKVKASLVVVIEMIAEAARFSVIERYVNRFDQRVLPLNSHLIYENSWGDLSDAIQSSNKNDGKFKDPLTLKKFYPDGKDRVIKGVAEVKSDIGIIKNPKTKLKGGYVVAEFAEEFLSVV